MKKARKLLFYIIFCFLTPTIYSQTSPELTISPMLDQMIPNILDTARFVNYITDSLLLGGGKLSHVAFYGNPKGVGAFWSGNDIGFTEGIMISNGHVLTSIYEGSGGGGGAGKRTGADGIPNADSLGPDKKEGGNLEPPHWLQDDDMDYLAGIISGPPIPPPQQHDTAVDPTVITFRFKPYYSTIWMRYVFASEEYQYQTDPLNPQHDLPVDVDMTDVDDGSDFMGIFFRKYPSEGPNPNNIASVVAQLGVGWVPVSVEYINHEDNWGYYVPNYDNEKSFIFDGTTTPIQIRPYPDGKSEIVPCQTYWVKIGVADYPNGQTLDEYHLNHQINSAVFLEAFSLMSGYGKEWEITGAIDNNDFSGDTSMVEGGCSNMIMKVKFSVMPEWWDTTQILMKIGNASLSEFTVDPPLVNDSVIFIPPSAVDPVTYEYTMKLSAIDDGIDENGGTDFWYIRYQMDPCDVPKPPDTLGQSNAGYSGKIVTKVLDYNPIVNTSKTMGPDPASIYHCGNDITVTISDILEGGIPPYTYSWSNPPQIANTELFTTTIMDSPDYAICTIFDRCTKPQFPYYIPGKDTVIIYSKLEIQASPDFQLCQNGQSVISVQSTNVGDDYTTVWIFNETGETVGTQSSYTVTWDEYGSYAPNTISFTCIVTDECGNTDSDVVNATFFPVVEISGVPLICLYDTIQLTCSPAQSYQWYYNSYPGTPIPGATSQTLNYYPTTAGNHTICVSIINECGEQADTCFSFFASQLIMDMTMNNSNNFNTCPNVQFSLKELNAYDGWAWSWEDDGTPFTASGQTITLELTEAGVHPVTVIAYNEDGCYDTLTRNVTVYPYAYPVASTSIESVCIDYPTDLSIVPTGPVSITNYYWTATPPDASLAGQQTSASPTVTPQVTTTYKCVITDNHGCLDSATVEVNVRPKLAGNILGDPGFQCTDKPVTITFQPTVTPLPDATYSWTFDDGVPATSNQAVPPQIVWSTDGLKNISLHIEELGCEATFYFQYQVYPDPLAAFSASGNFGCQPIEVSFQNASSNLENPSYLWDFGDGTTDTQTNPTHIYPNPGTYDITLTVTNSTGCTNTLTINDLVEVYEVPVADFIADPEAATIDNPTIKFFEQVNIPFALINWDFGDSSSVSTEPNPRHTYGAPGSYMVVMYTETEHGCWDRDTLEIGIVEDIKVFVPNAFTPNGDGLNDCFSISGTTSDIIDVFRVIIYSRWGTEVYDAPITTPECIWDGKDMSGNVLPADAYVFRIFGTNMRGAKKVYEGMVTIVK